MEQSKLYCQYKEDICPRPSVRPAVGGLFFAYPSKPETSAEAIQGAINLLSKNKDVDVGLIDWRDLAIEGNIIFCEICEAIRKSTCVVLNTTYVNFNIMFEYGYAIGAGKAIWPLAEEGVAKGDRIYTSINTLTTIGYSSFTNSKSIYEKLLKKKPWQRISRFSLPEVLGKDPTRDAITLLYLQSTIDNEASLRITEALSSIPMGRIVDNPREVPFQPLSWYLNCIKKSYAVIVHLGSERIEGYELHWARCALVAAIALALGRRLLILGENVVFRPIDYQDIIRSYTSANQAGEITREFVAPINNIIFDFRKYFQYDIGLIKRSKESKDDIFATIDLGDYTAENEEQALTEYFVETPQFLMALKPAFKVFIGRRGTGKTANFYMILGRLAQDKRNLICNIKPEEWQLNELLQFVKVELDKAKKGYLLQSLWKFMIYSEVLKFCFERVKQKPIYANLSTCEEAIKTYVEEREDISQLSFTGRLINTVRNICRRFDKDKTAEVAVSEILHERIIGQMHEMLMDYIQENGGNCAIVIDSLDANWKLGEDYRIMAEILLSLIETTKDMWRRCSRDLNKLSADRGLSILVFLRNDIFKAVLEVSREPDKLQYELISWKNVNALLEVVNKRILASLAGYDIDVLNWADILEPGFTPEDMKLFIRENVLCRPRDIIFLFQCCFYNARFRGASYLAKQDFETAMTEYSEHALKSLCAESQPYIPNMEALLYEFAGGSKILNLEDIKQRLGRGNISKSNLRKTVNYLIESNFLGFGIDDSVFHFPVTPTQSAVIAQKVWKRRKIIEKPRRFKIHNAFHNALLID